MTPLGHARAPKSLWSVSLAAAKPQGEAEASSLGVQTTPGGTALLGFSGSLGMYSITHRHFASCRGKGLSFPYLSPSPHTCGSKHGYETTGSQTGRLGWASPKRSELARPPVASLSRVRTSRGCTRGESVPLQIRVHLESQNASVWIRVLAYVVSQDEVSAG
jgi:hypothetical protein